MRKAASLVIASCLCSQGAVAGNAYQCPNTVPLESLYNRSGWYIGQHSPETGSYAGTIDSTATLSIQASNLIDESGTAHTWIHSTNGDAAGALPTGTVNLSMPLGTANYSAALSLDTIAPLWSTSSAQSQWPPTPSTGTMHALIVQRNFLRRSAGTTRRSDAMDFTQDHFEYRIQGSSDTTVDGVNRGQLTLGGATLDVEVVTEYRAPAGWGDNDYCWRLFNSNNGFKGFEIQLRPIVYVLGRDHSLAANMPDVAGEFQGTLELAYDSLPGSRPVY